MVSCSVLKEVKLTGKGMAGVRAVNTKVTWINSKQQVASGRVGEDDAEQRAVTVGLDRRVE